MKKTLLPILSALTFALSSASADVLLNYTFTAGSTASTDTEVNSTASLFSAGPGLPNTAYNNSNVPAAASVIGSDTTATQGGAIAGDDYWTFTLTPTAGYELDATSLTFGTAFVGSISTPIASFAIRSSVDNFGSDLTVVSQSMTTTPSFLPQTIDLSSPSFQNLTTPITFRVYLYGAVNGARRYAVDNVVLNGAIVVVPEPASYALLFGSVGAVVLLRRRSRSF
jgi:hypothetical protein